MTNPWSRSPQEGIPWRTWINTHASQKGTVKHYDAVIIGAGFGGLLKIAAAEADILNINPPVFYGKDYPNDPAMVK